MCELFGFSGRTPTDITAVLRTFFSHSITNPHGWGLIYNNGTLIREPVSANKSTLLPHILTNMPRQKITIAHIRYATSGSVTEKNCHPFCFTDISGRRWSFMHNGIIFSEDNIDVYKVRQSGSTDSERLFLAFMDNYNAYIYGKPISEKERFDFVNRFIIRHSPNNKLNLIIFDGEILYVHKNLENTLNFRTSENGILFSTVPLDDEKWTPFPTAQVIAYKNGKKIYAGEHHKGEFIPTPEYIKMTNAMKITS